jgi:hypothetical protein
MPVGYTIHYVPGKYYVAPAMSTAQVPYWNVIDDATRQPIGIFFSENQAQTICLALDLMHSTLIGDRTHVRELLKLIEGLRQ